PVADKTNLSEIVAECEVTELIAPTATDNCDGVITGTHDATLPITTQGVTVVTWTFTDAAGNKSKQEQFVSLNDYKAPVPDLTDLDDIYAINELAELTAPTAIDNCTGLITGTHNVTLPITAEGTTVVTWEYVDESGNTSSQTQNVIIEIDDEAPVADVEILSDLEAECEVTELTAPTATDNFSGTVEGEIAGMVKFPLRSSTTLTWVYTDESGNTSTQTQNVIIEDLTYPTIVCPEDQEVIANDGNTYMVEDGEFEIIDFSDNCSLVDYTNNLNDESELAGESLPLGVNSITWTIEDKGGNTTTCSHSITVTIATAMDEHLHREMLVYPNPANDYIIVKTEQSTQLRIYGLTGQLHKTGYTNQRLNISNLKKGIYLVKIDGTQQVSKISKQ
ncbi:MAG: HYR domain-containing protein, partial [Bacteroidales bacterium]|nr:HYR domain-containing protein [Bacteroidales bacterium]